MGSVGKRVRSSSVDKAEEKKVAKGMMGHDEHIRRVTKPEGWSAQRHAKDSRCEELFHAASCRGGDRARTKLNFVRLKSLHDHQSRQIDWAGRETSRGTSGC